MKETIFGYEWETIQAMQQKTHVAPKVATIGAGVIVPSQYEKNEWSRLAQDAYSKDRNDIGHRFSMAATLNKGEACKLAWFDSLQDIYREWLLNGFKNI